MHTEYESSASDSPTDHALPLLSVLTFSSRPSTWTLSLGCLQPPITCAEQTHAAHSGYNKMTGNSNLFGNLYLFLYRRNTSDSVVPFLTITARKHLYASRRRC